MNAATITDAKSNLEKIIRQVNSDAEPLVICADDGQKAVLLSENEFNSWQETIYLLSSPANAAHLKKSIAQAKSGKVVSKELI